MQVGPCFIWGPQTITSITFIVQPALLRGKRFKIQELAAYCNYFKTKKKITISQKQFLLNLGIYKCIYHNKCMPHAIDYTCALGHVLNAAIGLGLRPRLKKCGHRSLRPIVMGFRPYLKTQPKKTYLQAKLGYSHVFLTYSCVLNTWLQNIVFVVTLIDSPKKKKKYFTLIIRMDNLNF